MEKAKEFLQELGLPAGDRYALPTSEKHFADAAHYRVEIPSVEGPRAMEAILDEAQKRSVPVHRVSQGSGILLLTDSDIREMVKMGSSEGIEVSLFVGPRAPWEGTAQALTPNGQLVGWRHMGMDQLAYTLTDVLRSAELGIRSVLAADEGLIWLIGQARDRGLLPEDFVVKGSALLGAANPVGVHLLQEAGLTTINVASDISLPRLAAMREVLDIPIDLYIEAPDGLGGFVRHYELPELVRVAAPIYLKFGLRNAPNIYPSGGHLESTAIATGRERVRRAEVGLSLLARHGGNFTISEPGAPDLGVPVVSEGS